MRLSGGTEPIADWHAYLGFRATAELGAAPIVQGTNGEFVRSAYTDARVVQRLLDLLPCSKPVDVLPAHPLTLAHFAAKTVYWRSRYREHSALVDSIGAAERVAFVRRMAALCAHDGTHLDQMDTFYAEQRIRHFGGNGLHLSAASTATASPFVESDWLRVATRLPRRYKLGRRFHRHVVRTLTPELAEFPIYGRPRVEAAPSRFVCSATLPSETGYSPFAEVAARPESQEVLVESPLLDELATRAERERIAATQDRASMNLLLTLHFAAATAREAARQTAREVAA
jgi:hypothetical protein